MMSVEEARERIFAAVEPKTPQLIPIEQAWGEVLARDVFAQRTHPASDVSAMDGYAVRSQDITALPASLRVVEEIPAGAVPQKALGPNETARIFTGAALPEGADTIVLQEDTSKQPGDRVEILEIEPERHVRKRGLDFETGTLCAAAGTQLTSAHIGLLSAANIPSVYVYARPTVAFLSTGSELLPHGFQPGPGQIISSNGAMLSALARAAGAQALDLGPVEDDVTAIQERASGLSAADIAVTIGGASVGDHDLIQPALKPRGLDIDFWKIAMRPGKPLIFGKLEDVPFLGLPGNPVSAFVCALLFLKPMIEKMRGLKVTARVVPDATLTLTEPLAANGPRMTFMRARAQADGSGTVTPFSMQDSSVLSAVANATCLIIRPPNAPPAQSGTAVSILSLKGT